MFGTKLTSSQVKLPQARHPRRQTLPHQGAQIVGAVQWKLPVLNSIGKKEKSIATFHVEYVFFLGRFFHSLLS